MPFQPGERANKSKNLGGRPKGSLNSENRDIRLMIVEALHKSGGARYLQTQAAENPGAFLSLLGKVLPKDIRTQITGSLAYVVAPDQAASMEAWAGSVAPESEEPTVSGE